MDIRKNPRLRKVATGAVLCAAVVAVGGCTTGTEDELPSIVEETPTSAAATTEEAAPTDSFAEYTGVYDQRFYDDVEFYVGTEITVAAIVGEILSPNVFTIVDTVAGGDDAEDEPDIDDVDVRPLLIVHDQEIPGLTAGEPVGVMGVVREQFSLTAVEEDLEVDLDDATFEERDELAYLEADQVTPMTGES